MDPTHQSLLAAYGPLGGSSALHLMDPTVNPNTLPDVPRRFMEALNRGDSAAVLGFFEAAGTIVTDNGETFEGMPAITDWNARAFVGAKGYAKINNVSAAGNTVTVLADWKSQFYSGPGRFVFVLQGDRIVELRMG